MESTDRSCPCLRRVYCSLRRRG